MSRPISTETFATWLIRLCIEHYCLCNYLIYLAARFHFSYRDHLLGLFVALDVTAVTAMGDVLITEALETDVPAETSIQETPKDNGPLSEVEGTVEEIYLPNAHPVFQELRRIRTADNMGPGGGQFHPQEDKLNSEQVTSEHNVDNKNKTHELSTEPNAKEPVSKEENMDSDENKNEEQAKASLESVEPDENSNLTREPDGSEPNTVEPALQSHEEDDAWTGLFKYIYFNP